eukprot:154468-Chlamydomonas_euryale.AAC.1
MLAHNRLWVEAYCIDGWAAQQRRGSARSCCLRSRRLITFVWCPTFTLAAPSALACPPCQAAGARPRSSC